MDTGLIIKNYLLYFIAPLWIIPGFVDYFCHRRSGIESTSGLRESVIHLLLIIEMGIPVSLGLFFDINSLVILIMIIAYIAHELTLFWDVSYSSTKRHISTLEQYLHGYLGVLPFMLLSFIICLNWSDFLGLIGVSGGIAEYKIQLKETSLEVGYTISFLGLVLTFLILPYLEEFFRCLKVFRQRQQQDKFSTGELAD